MNASTAYAILAGSRVLAVTLLLTAVTILLIQVARKHRIRTAIIPWFVGPSLIIVVTGQVWYEWYHRTTFFHRIESTDEIDKIDFGSLAGGVPQVEVDDTDWINRFLAEISQAPHLSSTYGGYDKTWTFALPESDDKEYLLRRDEKNTSEYYIAIRNKHGECWFAHIRSDNIGHLMQEKGIQGQN